jgi:50S ribosomal protein L16 3-hydroxylase
MGACKAPYHLAYKPSSTPLWDQTKNMFKCSFKNIDKNQWLEKYWQKAPCLFKNAFDDPPDFLSPDELAGFSLQEELESRLIVQDIGSNEWSIEHGPFEQSRFSTLTESHWTLLVQSIDCWLPKTHQLLADFNFIPRWRFDDIMVSFATDQGGVGPHADNYDVFLIQGAGQRHWRVGAKGDTSKAKTVIHGMSHLQEFIPIIDVVMQPGDMLYIPPDTPHWGLSQGESIGYSVGYRSIQTHQMLALLTEKLAESPQHQQFFADLYRNKSNHSNFFERQVVQWAQKELVKLSKQPERLADLLAKQLSLSKLGIYSQDNPVDIQNITQDSEIQLQQGIGVNWLLFEGKVRLNIEGESFDFAPEYQQAIELLASFLPVSLKLFNFSLNLVDYPSSLANLVNRGYVKSIK